MGFEKVYEMIGTERKKSEEILKSKNEELEFFDDVVSNNVFSNIQGILDLDTTKVIAAYLCTISRKIPVDEIYDLIEKNKILLEPDFGTFRVSIFKILNNFKGDQLRFKDRKKLNILMEILNKQDVGSFDFDALKKLYGLYTKDLLSIINFVSYINEIKMMYNDYYGTLNKLKDNELKGYRMSKKDKDENVIMNLKNEFNVDIIYEGLSIISNYYNTLKEKEKNKKKMARKKIDNYDKLVELLKSLTLKKTLDKKNIDSILKLTDNKEISKEILYQINIEHRKHFDTLNSEYLKLSSDNTINIQAIFKKYKIDFNNLPTTLRTKILKLENEDIDKFLNSITKLKITNYNLICFILENSTTEVIDNFNRWIKDNIITLDFIINHKELLSIKDDTDNNYNYLLEKFKLFKNNGINYRSFICDLDIYLVDYDVLLRNINILREYNLLNRINSISSFELLKCSNLEIKIDLFLELGYENVLENNLSILNSDVDQIKKLYILKSMNLLPPSDKLIDIMDGGRLLDYITYVDSYIFNIVNYRIDTSLIEDNNLDLNESFSLDGNNRLIELDGVYLSKNRIKRNMKRLENIDLSNNDKMIYALIYGSILTEIEYDTILANLDDYKKRVYS